MDARPNFTPSRHRSKRVLDLLRANILKANQAERLARASRQLRELIRLGAALDPDSIRIVPLYPDLNECRQRNELEVVNDHIHWLYEPLGEVAIFVEVIRPTLDALGFNVTIRDLSPLNIPDVYVIAYRTKKIPSTDSANPSDS